MAILAQKWSKIAAQEKVNFLVCEPLWMGQDQQQHPILLCILWELAGGGSVAMAVGVSDM